MNNTKYPVNNVEESIWHKATFVLLGTACLVRLYFYLFPKDLWLDEAMLAVGIDCASWGELLRGQLIYEQSCPIAFAVINKLINKLTNYSPHAIYFLPTVAGMLLLAGLWKLCRIYEKNSLLAFICLALAASCKMPLYYSSEFKPYIFDGLATLVLLINVIRDLHAETFRDKILSFKYPLLFSAVLLVASASVFVSASIFLVMFIYLLEHEHESFFTIVKKLFSRYSIFFAVCLVYYFFFLRNNGSLQSELWRSAFAPHDISAWPQYFNDVIKPIWRAMFTVAFIKKIFPLFMLLSFLGGCYAIFKKDRYACAVCLLPFVLAFIASFGFYPPGTAHGGDVQSARLSFYLFPIIIFVSATGILFILNKFPFCINRNAAKHIMAGAICIFILCINGRYILNGMGHQQTFNIFNTVYTEKKDSDIVFVYSWTEPALRYWQRVNQKQFTYIAIPSDIFTLPENEFESMLPKNIFSQRKTFILYSHYWQNQPEKMEKILLKHGYYVETIHDEIAALQKVYK